MGAGIPNSVPATTLNKVCASGMKAISLAAQSIALGQNGIGTFILHLSQTYVKILTRQHINSGRWRYRKHVQRTLLLHHYPVWLKIRAPRARRRNRQGRPLGRLQFLPHGQCCRTLCQRTRLYP